MALVTGAALGADVVVTGAGRDPATFPEDEQRQSWRDIESTAEEVRAHGITVNAVCPGTVDAARMDGLGRGERWRQAVASISRGRPGADEKVAGLRTAGRTGDQCRA